MKKNTYDELKASASFDIENKKKRIKVAIMLKEILDVRVDASTLFSKIPDDPNYTDSTTNRHIFVLYNKLPQVYVEKIGDKWYYSQSTVDAIPQLHNKIFPFGTNIWAHWFPIKQNEEFFKLHPWQWIGVGIILTSFILCFFLLKYLFRFIFHKILFKKYVNEIQDVAKIKITANLFSIWIGFKIFQIFIPTLFINPKYSMPVLKGIDFAAASLIIIIVYKLVELFTFYAKKYAQKTTTQWDDQIVIVIQKFIKFLTIFFGLFYVLNTLDVNIATIIAGLSVGGLALALAAQDTVKNFIASVMIFIDKPFKIGDTIKGDTFEGTVLEVGFRSTRIKTAEDSVVYIANAKLSEMTIDNKGFRVFKKFKTEIIIPYETPLLITEHFLEGIRTILLRYPYIKNSSIDVFLTDLQNPGMKILISYTYKLYFQREEFQHREFILLQILKLADLLEIKLFEENKLLIQNNSEEKLQDTSIELKKKLEEFFNSYDQEISKIK